MKRSAINLNSEKRAHYKNLNLYNLVEAVNSVIKPGEEEIVPYIVNHILEINKAKFGRA